MAGIFDEALINDARARFDGLLLATERPGIRDLLKWLDEETDFFTAPASAKYHGAKEGGLLEHSLAVYDQLCRALEWYGTPCSAETAIIVALLHDLCKVNFYTREIKSLPKKDEQGKIVLDRYGKKIWEDTEAYTINDTLPYGHGEKSVFLASRFIRLTLEESMAVRWHMGLADTDYAVRQSLNQAMAIYPLILAVQMADMAATFWEGK